jgi:hypothetical protein
MTYSDKFNSLSCRRVFLRASRKKDPAEKKAAKSAPLAQDTRRKYAKDQRRDQTPKTDSVFS